ncbi:MAG: hypothetical protein AAGC46_18345, partial [Solirubrobacteraceae bacterium]|nr:hypothetical protein [Patulibacter sp.]
MARNGKREPQDDAAERVADAAEGLDQEAPTEVRTGPDADGPDTEVQTAAPLPIPPLLTDAEPASEPAAADAEAIQVAETFGSLGVAPDPGAVDDDAVLPEAPGEREAAVGAPAPDLPGAEPASRDRLAAAASSVAERAADRAGIARERAAEQAGVVRE